MRIRTITTGIKLKNLEDAKKIEKAAGFNNIAKDAYEKEGYEVQTTRVATNPWNEYLADSKVITEIKNLEKMCASQNITFLSIGYTRDPDAIATIPEIIKNTENVSCSAKIGDIETGIDYENVVQAAKAIKRISQATQDGYGNFRFCAWANCSPGIPFFPVSFHLEEETAFAIGLECGDLVNKAFTGAENLVEAKRNLKKIFAQELKNVEKIAKDLSQEFSIKYRGIDTSLAPSLEKEGSLVYAYEKLGFGKFGEPGSLAISAIITEVLKNLPVQTCGYAGLMLPVCEDLGLAERANEKTYDLTNLLLYSAVCGCGLDTIPLPGDITDKKIEAILLDVATMALRLNKPLAARLFPVPGKKAGDRTNFNSPYLVNCRILKV